MPTFRTAKVTQILAERSGLQRVRVRFADPDQRGDRAYVLTELTGRVAVDDDVIVKNDRPPVNLKLMASMDRCSVIMIHSCRSMRSASGPDNRDRWRSISATEQRQWRSWLPA